MNAEQQMVALHRYFIWADRMRAHFDEQIRETGSIPFAVQDDTQPNPYMSYWYGGTYVVIEGWKKLGLSDPIIETLLESPNIEMLKRYRNGVFHFQKDYFDDRFVGFIRDGQKSVEWVRKLRQELSRFFLDWFRQKDETK
ncbi:hypothetical protein E3J62_07620 [candidate division TA06 bacterium]|uniref:Uncharacterized protein n=1 Tax=candidate division TA06 bacterium TaxID=2250710 RepID=A0A523USA0_UNCT6|nr:MAG: hypothetical protein E3J62_07620 [candidate division TA06 bacterium]